VHPRPADGHEATRSPARRTTESGSIASPTTRSGVLLIRQTSRFGCRPTSWGSDAGGVWVDHDCHGEFDPTGRAGNGREGTGGQIKTIGVGTGVSVRNNETIGVQKRVVAWSSMAQCIGMSLMKTVTLPSPGAHIREIDG
jgi:Protein of unknown function (DUF3011)